MVAGIYNFEDHTKGDTYEGAEEFTIIDADVPDLTGATIRMHIRNQNNDLVKSIDTSGGITITDAVNKKFKINAFDVELSACTYYYDIEVTFSNDVIVTYLKGTWTIIQDITY